MQLSTVWRKPRNLVSSREGHYLLHLRRAAAKPQSLGPLCLEKCERSRYRSKIYELCGQLSQSFCNDIPSDVTITQKSREKCKKRHILATIN